MWFYMDIWADIGIQSLHIVVPYSPFSFQWYAVIVSQFGRVRTLGRVLLGKADERGGELRPMRPKRKKGPVTRRRTTGRLRCAVSTLDSLTYWSSSIPTHE
jgi:hypothetical protein